MSRYIDAEQLITEMEISIGNIYNHDIIKGIKIGIDLINSSPTADVVEVDKIAQILQISHREDCACDFNGNDEWLSEVCEYREAECPYPTEENGCWKQYVKHILAKMDGKKVE